MDYDDQKDHQEGSLEKRVMAASALSELMKGLDDEMVTLAVLRHVDGLTQEEIAESMSLSRRTIVKKLKKFDQHIDKKRSKPKRAGS